MTATPSVDPRQAHPASAPSHAEVAVRHVLTGAPSRDHVVVEAPLDVRVAGADGPGHTLAVTMRTPGDDLALAIGLAWSEGLLRSPDDLLDASWCDRDRPESEADAPTGVLVRLRRTPDLRRHARHGVMSSACGVCGRTTMEDLDERVGQVQAGRAPVPDPVDPRLLLTLPDRLRAAQEVFGTTGGLHAVARFDRDGALLDHAEDVGRHNAFDKVVGRSVRSGGLPWTDDIVLLSGRASYELLAKAAMVGARVVASIGAPSSLAIEIAERHGICLVGFLRDGHGNVHTHHDLVQSSGSDGGGAA